MTEDPLGLKLLDDAGQLRIHLDQLNEAGDDDRCVGVDSLGEPFLAALTGVYADGIRILSCDPDDRERYQGKHCDACGQATDELGPETLHYPVVVLTGRPQ